MISAMKLDPAIEIEAHPDVYPPSEDTEMLIRSFNVDKGEKVLEIGCGSGIVAIQCAKNGAFVTCCDINPAAVELTRRNAKTNSVNLDVHQSDLFSDIEGRFDTIVFNLPYLPVEEDGMLAKAWSGGLNGLGPLPKLLKESPDHLTGKSRLILVVSSLMDQSALDAALKGLKVVHLSDVHMFFETMGVLEIDFSL